MKDSIFTKIIRGDIPAHKIYEDDKTFAFLDIYPDMPGHTLIVPKLQVDKFYDLPDEDYTALFATTKKLAAHMEKVLGQRTLLRVIGIDVPHAHVHLIPYSPDYKPGTTPKLADEASLKQMAEKLRLS